MRATLCYLLPITHREMRNNSAEILHVVADGETVRVTNNVVVAAVIGPSGRSVLAQSLSEGPARPARRPLSELWR